MVDEVLQKSLFHLDLFNSEPHIVTETHITPIHLGEQLIASLYAEIIVCNYAFFKDPKSILHVIPLLVVETTCALQVFHLFSKLFYPTSNSDMGFCKPCIFFSIFKIIFYLFFNNLPICLQVQLRCKLQSDHLIHLVSQFFVFKINRLLSSPYNINHLNL